MSYAGCKAVPRFSDRDAMNKTKLVTREPALGYGRPGTPLGGPPRPEGVAGPVDGRAGAIVGAMGEPRRPGASADLPCTACCTSIAQIGRASCRERVESSVGGGALRRKEKCNSG